MNYKSKIGIIAAMAAITLVAMPLPAQAQKDGGSGDIGSTVIASLNLQDVDVRDGVRALFKNVNVNYLVASEVQGTITIELKNVKFEVALRNILDQVNATFRIEGGVYNIVKKDEKVEPTPEIKGDPLQVLAKRSPVRIYLNHADPALIIRLLAGQGASTSLLPEMSTITNGNLFGGSGGSGYGGSGNRGGNGGTGGSGFGGSGSNGGSGFGNSGSSGSGNAGGGFGRG